VPVAAEGETTAVSVMLVPDTTDVADELSVVVVAVSLVVAVLLEVEVVAEFPEPHPVIPAIATQAANRAMLRRDRTTRVFTSTSQMMNTRLVARG